MAETAHRDLVVIGCSAGGVDALPRLIGALPAGFPGGVIVVQHITAGSELASIIQTKSALPVKWAEQGDKIEPGHVYVAPPDAHLLVIDSHIRLDGGPRENFFRPAIDRAFRSVAAFHGPRAIGVVLTGMLDDGVLGLAAIRACGGYAIVEDPATAAFPDLPAHALAQAGTDALLPLADIAPLLSRLIGEPVEPRAIPSGVALEAELDRVPATPGTLDRVGPRSPIPCPECQGPMWEAGDRQSRHFRCYLGHSATPPAMLRHSREELEHAMWTAIRALHDRATTFETLARDAGDSGNHVAAEAYGLRAREATSSAETTRRFLLSLGDRG